MTGPLLGAAAETDAARRLAAEDLAALGFVSNAVQVWLHDPEAWSGLFDVVVSSARAAGLSFAEQGIATVAATSVSGDTYCPLAWGNKLAGAASPELAAAVLQGSDVPLDDRGRAIASWARTVAGAPYTAAEVDVERLRTVGFDDAQILRLTLFIALRVAFAAVHGALGARPEQEYVDVVDPVVRSAWARAVGRDGPTSSPDRAGSV